MCKAQEWKTFWQTMHECRITEQDPYLIDLVWGHRRYLSRQDVMFGEKLPRVSHVWCVWAPLDSKNKDAILRLNHSKSWRCIGRPYEFFEEGTYPHLDIFCRIKGCVFVSSRSKCWGKGSISDWSKKPTAEMPRLAAETVMPTDILQHPLDIFYQRVALNQTLNL
jgi:hypothetical protein